MPTISNRLSEIRQRLHPDTTLVAVSKFHPLSTLHSAYKAGQRIFGESRAQELQKKYQSMPKDVEWHFIGHLQTNKVKDIAPFISLIHSVDSPHLLSEINKQAQKINRKLPCLLQLHVAEENSKFGFIESELRDFLNKGAWRDLQYIQISGLMCMASFTSEVSQIQAEFLRAKTMFDWMKEHHFKNDPSFNIKSWGMSDDYPIALKCGSNMIRVGSSIFGQRA